MCDFQRNRTSLAVGDVLVEVDSTVGELAERALGLKGCEILSVHVSLQSVREAVVFVRGVRAGSVRPCLALQDYHRAWGV
jgi:hypothetical protein